MLKRLKNVRYCIPMLVIVLSILTLLTYIGYNETKLKYLPFQLNKLAAQGEIVKTGFDGYLNAGLPIEQFSGFRSIASTLLKSDSSIENIRVINLLGDIIFFESNDGSEEALVKFKQRSRTYYNNPLEFDFPAAESLESEQSYVIKQILTSKFGPVGAVLVEANKKQTIAELNQQFELPFQAIIGLTLLFLFIVIAYELLGAQKLNRSKVFKIAYVFCYLALSVLISKTVYSVYESGANATTLAMSDSMVQRLTTAKDVGVDLDDLSGIDQMLEKYKSGNRTIAAIALIKGDINIAHTDPAQIGKLYQMVPNSYEYVNQLDSEQGEALDFRVAVNIPKDVLLQAILSSTKAFVVLFIACALIAFIFLNAGTSLIEMFNKRAKSSAKELANLNFETGLHLIQPAYFMIVLVNALFVPFLPKLIADIADESIYSYATASLPFTLYYLVFALVLIPAGQYAERGNLKKMMVLGFIAEFFGMLLIFLSDDYILIVSARILSGIGQGLFLIGLQSYVMAITPKTQRSRGHAVKVVGRNAAMIAGTAIGALLYAYIEYRIIFLLGSVISLLSIAYLWNLVPKPESITGKLDRPLTENNDHPWQKLRRSITKVMRDAEFLRTLTLVGIVGKMSIAGVVMFAIPLMMFSQGYKADDVGLMLMFYYISSMVMTSYVARIVDGAGMSRKALILSAMLGGLAIVVVGLVSQPGSSYETLMAGMEPLVWLSKQFIEAGMGASAVVLYIAIILLGISNGLLAAPVMTHINNTDVSRKEGIKQVAATYVFLERFGHVAGPAVIAHLLFLNNNAPLSISLFGVIMVVLGGVYMVTSRGAEKTASSPVLKAKVAS